MVKKIKHKTKDKNKENDNLIDFSLDVFNLIKDNSYLLTRLKILPVEVSKIFYTVAELNPSVAVHIDRIIKQNINPDTNSLRYRNWLLTEKELELMCMFQILPDEATVSINEEHIEEPIIETPKIEIIRG